MNNITSKICFFVSSVGLACLSSCSPPSPNAGSQPVSSGEGSSSSAVVPVGEANSSSTAKNSQTVELEINKLINDYRAKRGLRSLKVDPSFRQGAREHTQYMYKDAMKKGNKMHISHDRFQSRADGLRRKGTLGRVAENVGVTMGQSPSNVASILVNGWINSPGHHRNIVGDYSVSGVGVVMAPGNLIYATQLFGGK